MTTVPAHRTRSAGAVIYRQSPQPPAWPRPPIPNRLSLEPLFSEEPVSLPGTGQAAGILSDDELERASESGPE